MKRGFLNTAKAKQKLPQASDARADESTGSASQDKGKGKAKVETLKDDINEFNFKPGDLPLLDLHSLPPPMKSKRPKGHDRFIFRHWPRDPNGKPILPSEIHGKEAANGLDFWGATLYDFYFVHRMPHVENFMTISTGSKLTKVMQAFGELSHAEDEMAWAAREVDPKEIPAWDPAEAIVEYERRVHAGSNKKAPAVPVPIPEGAAEAMDTGDSVDERSTDTTDDRDAQHLLFDISMNSPFHPSHYPPPWPFSPFESAHTPFTLQRTIPTHLLPKKLHVHDPWNLVCIDRDPGLPHDEEDSCTSKMDYIRTYSLTLPPESQAAAEKAASAAVAEDEAAETVFIAPQEMEGPTEQPAIRAFLPKRPRKPTEVPEAHLYLSPKGALGTGNHSIVYEAELELPRNLFCQSTYCKVCLDEQIKIEVDRLKESGEWGQRMNEAADRYRGPRRLDLIAPGVASSSSVQLSPRHVGFVTWRLEHVPSETLGMVDRSTLRATPLADAPMEHLSRVSDAMINRYIEYEGPVVPVYPNIQWQDPSCPETICKHQAPEKKPVPKTARFRVAAKLSLPRDGHLAREARNYLKFPAHFFQHWNGYNVVPPLHDPTPVGALVPQFFGYYTPDDPSDPGEDEYYRSPILLIEHCGAPINVSKLCIDDRHECAALLFRFHAAGWLHASFAERNIMMQKQQPTCSPLEDEDKCELPHKHRRYSFRLIDFGRSVECETSERRTEESEGRMLFGIL